jgi:hypothetical protein
VLPDGLNIPAIAVARHTARESGKVRTQLQGTIIAHTEKFLAINSKEFFRLGNGDPAFSLSHDVSVKVNNSCTVTARRQKARLFTFF